ncbi:MAG TPA: hypothetical protein VFQ68_14460 [Streptosporangiaceae bacterium]|nr:hypothetical protein [Streptosporangiaceae bacterium]
MLSRWQGGLGALIVTLAACALVILDLADHGLRRWWAEHALTTGTVSGLLVLLITVLVADQVLKLRQINDRARAVAAQAAILTGQAIRSSQAVSQVLAGAGDRDAAGDEFRTYHDDAARRRPGPDRRQDVAGRPRRPAGLTGHALPAGTARSRHTPSKRGTGSRAVG